MLSVVQSAIFGAAAGGGGDYCNLREENEYAD